MFDLKKEIAKWRKTLLQKQTCDGSDLDELEDHLLDEIDQLKTRGLSEQEAFLIATHRLGDTDALANEFAKVNESLWMRKKLFYAGCGLFAYIAASYIAQAFSKIFLLLATSLGLRGYAAGIFDPASRITIFGLIIFLWYMIAKKKDPDGERFSKTADSLKGKVVLLTIAFLLMIILVAARTIITAAIARTVGAQDFSQIAMPTALFMQLVCVVEPVVLMMVLIYLRPTRYGKLA